MLELSQPGKTKSGNTIDIIGVPDLMEKMEQNTTVVKDEN